LNPVPVTISSTRSRDFYSIKPSNELGESCSFLASRSLSAPLHAATLSVVGRPLELYKKKWKHTLTITGAECRLTCKLVWLQDINTIVTYVITPNSPAIRLVVSENDPRRCSTKRPYSSCLKWVVKNELGKYTPNLGPHHMSYRPPTRTS